METQKSISREIKSDNGHFEIPAYEAETIEVRINDTVILAVVVPCNGVLKCYWSTEKKSLQFK